MNQHQVTVTRGDEPTVSWSIPDDYTDATAQLRVENLFSATATVTPDSGGTTTISVDLISTDTENDADVRKAYPYSVRVTTAEGDVLTVRRGLFVVVPEVDDPEG